MAATDACLNCGAALSGRFCAACGQKRAQPLDAPRVLRDGLGQLLDADNAWWTTLRELTLRPGPTIRRYVAGERKRFVNPVLYMLTMATAFLLAITALGVDLGGVQAVPEAGRANFELMIRSVGYLVIVGALPAAWLMQLVLRFALKQAHSIGALYVLLVYSYAQLALLQTILYGLGAADSAMAFAASRFVSALYFAWALGGYFGWRPVGAVIGGLLSYAMLMAVLIACGSVLIFLRIAFSAFLA